MAAPTRVRAESNTAAQAKIRWLPDELAALGLYRSDDGVSYSLVTALLATDTSYVDNDLAERTKYWYKLSDDSGSTFSSVVTVVTQGSRNRRVHKARRAPARVRDDDSPAARAINEASDELNAELHRLEVRSTPCPACIVDGAVMLDCSGGCRYFQVLMSEDVTSIELQGCDDCPEVDFVIPPNEERGICGWPIGCDFFGDECDKGRIPGGPLGRTAKANGLSYDSYGESPARQSDCPCSPDQELAIKCCDEDDCELNCS